MIVRPEGPTYLLITQPDHAQLSGAIMKRWQADGLPAHPRRQTILLATAEHDNGWIEPDAVPQVDDAGKPYDFIAAPDTVKQGVWPRGVARLAQQDRRAGALVAQHALTVLRHYHDSAGWTAFFERMEALKREHLGEEDEAELRSEYHFVFLGDLLSLVFCNGWRDDFTSHGYTLRLTENRLRVRPDPFGGEVVPLRIRAKPIAARPYRSDHDLRMTVAAAPDTWIEGSVEGAAS